MFLVVPLAFKTNQRYSLTTVKLLLNDIVHANMVVEKKKPSFHQIQYNQYVQLAYLSKIKGKSRTWALAG